MTIHENNPSTIRQHLPASFSGFENAVAVFATLDDLLAIPFVANFTDIPEFYRFSLDDRMMMAEYALGRQWFVVGFIDGDRPALPVWLPVTVAARSTN